MFGNTPSNAPLARTIRALRPTTPDVVGHVHEGVDVFRLLPCNRQLDHFLMQRQRPGERLSAFLPCNRMDLPFPAIGMGADEDEHHFGLKQRVAHVDGLKRAGIALQRHITRPRHMAGDAQRELLRELAGLLQVADLACEHGEGAHQRCFGRGRCLHIGMLVSGHRSVNDARMVASLKQPVARNAGTA